MDELIEVLCPIISAQLPESTFDKALDAVDGADVNPGEGWEAWDDVKHRPLDPKLVQDARGVEMQYVKEHRVYGYATIEECRKVTGREPVDTRWIDTNKGDEGRP